MQLYQIIDAAKEDLIDIWCYSAKQFGEAQADHYVRLLEQKFEKIGKGELQTKQPLENHSLLRVARCEHHYVFFIKKEIPVVIAILHEKMNLIARIEDRLDNDPNTNNKA